MFLIQAEPYSTTSNKKILIQCLTYLMQNTEHLSTRRGQLYLLAFPARAKIAQTICSLSGSSLFFVDTNPKITMKYYISNFFFFLLVVAPFATSWRVADQIRGSVADADEDFTLKENEYLFNIEEGNDLDLTDAHYRRQLGKGKGETPPPEGKGKGKGKGGEPEGKGKGKGKGEEPEGKGKGKGKGEEPEGKGKGGDSRKLGKGKGEDPEPEGKGKGKGKGEEPEGKGKGKGKGEEQEGKGKGKGKGEEQEGKGKGKGKGMEKLFLFIHD
jgi:hypothetical protein